MKRRKVRHIRWGGKCHGWWARLECGHSRYLWRGRFDGAKPKPKLLQCSDCEQE